jgi:hypothetical protein
MIQILICSLLGIVVAHSIKHFVHEFRERHAEWRAHAVDVRTPNWVRRRIVSVIGLVLSALIAAGPACYYASELIERLTAKPSDAGHQLQLLPPANAAPTVIGEPTLIQV